MKKKCCFRALFIGFVLSIVCQVSFLHCVPISENWEEYRTNVLKEQPNFSGWCLKEKALRIMNLLMANPSEICVEVGVFGGSSFFPIASTLAFKKQGLAYAIDPWSIEACVENYKPEDEAYKGWSKTDLKKVMYKFVEGMHKNQLDPFFLIMRVSSAQAYHYFEDKSIDFIHIDGNHSEASAVFDVEHWLPKVKSGGIICFDDAHWESTQPAVKILLNTCQLMPESNSKKQYLFLRKP
jgi:hypothetical protein